MTGSVARSLEKAGPVSKPIWLRGIAGALGFAVLAIPYVILFQVAQSDQAASMLWPSMLGVALPCLAALMLFRVAFVAKPGLRFN